MGDKSVPTVDPLLYRANFGDGTYTRGWADIRDARRAIWGRAGIVQYRSFIERLTDGVWTPIGPSRAMLNGPVIVNTSDR